MENERFQRGVDKLADYTKGQDLNGLKKMAPELRQYIMEFGYSDIYKRPELNNRQRALATISSFILIRDLEQN